MISSYASEAPLRIWSEELPQSGADLVTIPLSCIVEDMSSLFSSSSLPWGVLYFNSTAAAYMTALALSGKIVGGERLSTFMFDLNSYLRLIDLSNCSIPLKKLTNDKNNEFMDLFPLCEM